MNPPDEATDPLPAAAPAFRAHFTDPLYDDPAGEFSPFGTDDGWDLLLEWGDRRDEVTRETTVRQLLAASDFDWVEAQLDQPEQSDVPEPEGQIDAATITVGAGFTLLRLTGHIDPAGKALVLRALGILTARYDSPPELLRERDDLQSWQA